MGFARDGRWDSPSLFLSPFSLEEEELLDSEKTDFGKSLLRSSPWKQSLLGPKSTTKITVKALMAFQR